MVETFNVFERSANKATKKFFFVDTCLSLSNILKRHVDTVFPKSALIFFENTVKNRYFGTVIKTLLFEQTLSILNFFIKLEV